MAGVTVKLGPVEFSANILKLQSVFLYPRFAHQLINDFPELIVTFD